MRVNQTREDWEKTLTLMTKFCDVKKRKIQSSDWKDQTPDAGILEDVEVISTPPPGGGMSPSSGPGGASESAETRVPAPEDKEEEECPDPKRTKKRVTVLLMEVIVRDISPGKEQHMGKTYFSQIGRHNEEEFRDRCKTLQERVTDPEINALVAVRYGVENVSRHGIEKWTSLVGEMSHPKNHFIVVDAESCLYNATFSDPQYKE